MVGVKGRSGGRRAGTGRRPGAKQIKSKPKSNGISKALPTKDEGSPKTSSLKKLTSFFAKKSAVAGSGVVRALPLPTSPIPPVHFSPAADHGGLGPLHSPLLPTVVLPAQ